MKNVIKKKKGEERLVCRQGKTSVVNSKKREENLDYQRGVCPS